MIDALEWERDAAALDDFVPAAAVWVVFAGKALKSNVIPYAQHPHDGGTSRLPWSVGPLWKGLKGILMTKVEPETRATVDPEEVTNLTFKSKTLLT